MSGFHDAIHGGIPVGSVDYIVVGSGAGGGAAARVLAASGRSVLVLEEGPRATAGEVGVVTRESMRRLMRQQGKMVAFGRSTIPILQGRCVGGTTFVNSAIIWRLPEKVLARWHRDFGLADGLPAAALDAAYAQIESEMKVRPVDERIAGRNSSLMRDAAAALGIEARYLHRNEEGCKGSARCLFGCPNDAKQSTAINYLRRAVDDGADVVAQARVDRVLLDGDRAVGVAGTVLGYGRNRPFHVRANRAVVVAASAIQSPNLLRRSGLASRRREIGEHFMAHPGQGVMALYPDPVHAWSGASQGYEAFGLRDTVGVKFESINVPPDVAIARLPGAGRHLARYMDRVQNLAVWSCALRADAEGRIRPSLLFGDRVSYTLGPADMERFRTGLKVLSEMHLAAGATEVFPAVHGMPEAITSPDQLRLFDDAPLDPRAYGMVATHLFGGCRAGADPARSVVDPQLKVHGVDGLYVMDASIFPTNTGVNPQHSIMAVATVAAQRLAAA